MSRRLRDGVDLLGSQPLETAMQWCSGIRLKSAHPCSRSVCMHTYPHLLQPFAQKKVGRHKPDLLQPSTANTCLCTRRPGRRDRQAAAGRSRGLQEAPNWQWQGSRRASEARWFFTPQHKISQTWLWISWRPTSNGRNRACTLNFNVLA